jgi:hypothetical protein
MHALLVPTKETFEGSAHLTAEHAALGFIAVRVLHQCSVRGPMACSDFSEPLTTLLGPLYPTPAPVFVICVTFGGMGVWLWWCLTALGSAAPMPCGSPTLYCPSGGAAPLVAGLGFYTDGGTPTQRSVRMQCAPGQYCPGDGMSYDCPPGTYGSTPGLNHFSCSGPCGDGVQCDAHTTSPSGLPCQAGQYCVQGLSMACPPGTFSATVGATNSSACIQCTAGRFSNATGATSNATCESCSAYEGSDPGATTCWPGIMGVCSIPYCVCLSCRLAM